MSTTPLSWLSQLRCLSALALDSFLVGGDLGGVQRFRWLRQISSIFRREGIGVASLSHDGGTLIQRAVSASPCFFGSDLGPSRSCWTANGGKTKGCVEQIRSLSDIPCSDPRAGPFRKVSKPIPNIFLTINEQIMNSVAEGFEDLRIRDPKITMEAKVDALVAKYKDIIRKHRLSFNHVNVSTLVHRIGRFIARCEMQDYLCTRHSDLVAELLVLVYAQADNFASRNLANVMWGLGKIGPGLKGIPVPLLTFQQLMQKMGEAAKVQFQINTFSHRHLSNFLYGAARLEDTTSMRALILQFARHGKTIVDDFLDQELANFVWALAKLNYLDNHGVLPVVVESAKKRVDTMAAQEVSNILWGLAMMNYYDCEELLDGLLIPQTQSKWRKTMSSQSLSNFVWSAHSLHMKIDEAEGLRLLDGLFSGLKETIQETPSYHLDDFDAQHVTSCLYVYSEFGYKSKWVFAFVRATKVYFEHYKDRFNMQDISMLAWSLAMLDELDDKTMSAVLRFVRFSKPTDPLKPQDARQLYQCLLHLKIFHPEIKLTEDIPEAVEALWRHNWVERQKTSPLPEWMSVALVYLEQMGCVCKGRSMVGGILNTCTLDFEDGLKFAVEGLSYARRFYGGLYPPKARFLWKRKTLEALGYEVIVLDERKWALLSGKENTQKYLQEMVDAARAKTRLSMLGTKA
ncbi:hypothetical protein BSKO_10029 [Bryopsis sp. KO-2023]|nr:hypothetical protein BSKO_10029 [Bryopsis sp. KO-2023]